MLGIRRPVRLICWAGALCVLAAPSAALTQEVGDAARFASHTPRCAEVGLSTFAFVIPPGQTAEGLLEVLAETEPDRWAGVQLQLLSSHEYPRLLNPDQVNSRLRRHLQRMVDQGWQISGEVRAFLSIDEEGVVQEVAVQSGHRRLDQMVKDVWIRSRFEPTTIGGECRTRLWMVAPFSFEQDERGALTVRACYSQ
jgi:hypothetical protein